MHAISIAWKPYESSGRRSLRLLYCLVMRLPAECTFRPPTMADVDRVAELVRRAEVDAFGEPMLDASDIESDWKAPDFDLLTDAILVESPDGRLVACAELNDAKAMIDVDPDWCGLGIGSSLVTWSEHRFLEIAPQEKDARIGQTIHRSDTRASNLIAAYGYEEEFESWVLSLPDHASRSTQAVPGIEIRPYLPSEEQSVYTVIDDAFSEWEGRDSKPFESWRARVTLRPDFDPALLFVAIDNAHVVGACVALQYPGEGWVDQLAVQESHRGRGIAKALLVTAFSELRRRGETKLGLNTDSRTGALGLYTGIGMELDHTFVRWSKTLR